MLLLMLIWSCCNRFHLPVVDVDVSDNVVDVVVDVIDNVVVVLVAVVVAAVIADME
jgi:hypothetical protein